MNVHDDGTVALNTAQEPVPKGSYITVYMTGEGQTDPRGVDGSVAITAGAMQVNLLVPPDAPTGAAVPLVIQVGDKQSQAGITVAIGN